MKTGLLRSLPLACLAMIHPMLAWAEQSTAPAAPPYPGWGMPYHGPMWGAGMGHGWGGPLLLLGLIAICVLIFLLIRRSGCCGCHPHHGHCHMKGPSPGAGPGWGDPTYSALQILNERYARGEIQKQEYEEKKSAILGGNR